MDEQKPDNGKKPKTKKLTLKKQIFAESYIANNGNGLAAMREAGYKGGVPTLNKGARENLQNPIVQEYIRERLRGVKANTDEVLYLLADHMRADIACLDPFMLPNGLLDLKRAKQAGVSHLIKKLKYEPAGIDANGQQLFRISIEMHDSQTAARTLAKIQGLEQNPRQNQDDVARVNAEVARLVGEGWEPEQARQIVIDAEPSAAKWLM